MSGHRLYLSNEEKLVEGMTRNEADRAYYNIGAEDLNLNNYRIINVPSASNDNDIMTLGDAKKLLADYMKVANNPIPPSIILKDFLKLLENIIVLETMEFIATEDYITPYDKSQNSILTILPFVNDYNYYIIGIYVLTSIGWWINIYDKQISFTADTYFTFFIYLKDNIQRPFWLTRLPQNSAGLYFTARLPRNKITFDDIKIRGFSLTNNFRIQYMKQKKTAKLFIFFVLNFPFS